MAKEATNPNQAYRENDTAYQFTKTLANIPLSMRELRNRPPKSWILSSFFLLSSSSFSYKTLD